MSENAFIDHQTKRTVHILLLEDNADDALLLERELKRDKNFTYILTRVGSLEQGLSRISRDCFDLALLDLNLPDSRGLDTFNRFRHAAAGIPLIVLTGIRDDDLYSRILHEGAQDYIIKGENKCLQLLKTIKNAIERQQFVRQLEERENRIDRLNRIYVFLSEVNQAIVRIREPENLFNMLCNIGVEAGGFDMVWIGRFNEGEKHVEVIARAGLDFDYFRVNTIPEENMIEFCPVYQVMNGKGHVVCNLVEGENARAACQKAAAEAGIRSTSAFAITVNKELWGCICFYSGKPGYFNEDEIKILTGLSSDISFALEFFESEQKRKLSEEESRKIARFSSESPFPVMRFDREGSVLYANLASDIIRANWSSSSRMKAPSEWIRMIKDYLAPDLMREMEFRCGTRIFSLRFTADSGSDYINVYGNDITELKNTENALKEKIREAEKFNSLMVGRELKMSELKQEINRLRIESGMEIKYKIVE